MPFKAAYGLAEPLVSRCQLTTKAKNKPELPPHYSKPQELKMTMTTPGPQQSAAEHFPNCMYSRELASDQQYESTSEQRSAWLNTKTKRKTRRGLLDKLHE
jgi:hypothetical protein